PHAPRARTARDEGRYDVQLRDRRDRGRAQARRRGGRREGRGLLSGGRQNDELPGQRALVASSAMNSLATLLTSERFRASLILFVGSRRFSRAVVRNTAQSSALASTATAAPSSSPRVTSQAPSAARRL